MNYISNSFYIYSCEELNVKLVSGVITFSIRLLNVVAALDTATLIVVVQNNCQKNETRRYVRSFYHYRDPFVVFAG